MLKKIDKKDVPPQTSTKADPNIYAENANLVNKIIGKLT